MRQAVRSVDSSIPKVSFIASMPLQIFIATLSGIVAHQRSFDQRGIASTGTSSCVGSRYAPGPNWG